MTDLTGVLTTLGAEYDPEGREALADAPLEADDAPLAPADAPLAPEAPRPPPTPPFPSIRERRGRRVRMILIDGTTKKLPEKLLNMQIEHEREIWNEWITTGNRLSSLFTRNTRALSDEWNGTIMNPNDWEKERKKSIQELPKVGREERKERENSWAFGFQMFAFVPWVAEVSSNELSILSWQSVSFFHRENCHQYLLHNREINGDNRTSAKTFDEYNENGKRLTNFVTLV